ncbi:MAG TPA: MFS transporter [Dehalococcoidia bacterium]|nr:MFS transporter [Dehalococcoidia bacterium]
MNSIELRGSARDTGRTITLGLRANWRQFALLVAVNAFVGGMVGLERSIVPLLAEEEFGVASKAAAVSFIATFGLAKAIANLYAGRLSERFTRKSVLMAGWLFGLPVPFILIAAPSWEWVVAANALLGLNQGLAWSMTVNMKMDLVGPERRGLALGLNEAAGYLAVGLAAFATGAIADRAGLRPEPFYLGIGFAAIGTALSALAVRDTSAHVGIESALHPTRGTAPSLPRAFADATWRRPQLFGISQAGFANNLNDALAWGIFPLFFAANGMRLGEIGLLAAVYPFVWGALQVVAGWASDRTGRRPLIVAGMLAQAAAIVVVAASRGSFAAALIGVAALGIGTALVYPTLLAAVGDLAHPNERATLLGVYRFWRDAGAMAGAVAAGALADILGYEAAIAAVAALTALSGLVAAATLQGRPSVQEGLT